MNFNEPISVFVSLGIESLRFCWAAVAQEVELHNGPLQHSAADKLCGFVGCFQITDGFLDTNVFGFVSE